MPLLGSFFLAMFALLFTGLLVATGRATDDPDLRVRERFAALRTLDPATLGGNAGELLKGVPAAATGVNQWLMRSPLAGRLEVLARQAAKPTTVQAFLRRCGVCVLSGSLLAFLVLHSWLLAMLVGGACGTGPLLVLKAQRTRRLQAFDKALPEVIEMMSRSLRAGHALVAAISIAAEQAPEPARAEFAELFRQQNFGLPLRDAMMQMLDRTPSQDLRVLVTAILVQKDTGGNLTQILDRTAAVIRERLKLQGDIRVHTAQGRMTGWILCLLPVVMLLLINLINPGYSRNLTGDPFGRKLLWLGGALLTVGALLIRRIVNGIEI